MTSPILIAIFRITQRHSNTHRLSSTSHFGGTGGTCNHQCSNQTHTMPSSVSSNTSVLISTSAASISGSNPSPPPISLPNTIMSPSSGGSGVAVPGEDSEGSDFGQNEPSTSNSRSRQKKFLKNFKQLPQEEVVLQREYKMKWYWYYYWFILCSKTLNLHLNFIYCNFQVTHVRWSVIFYFRDIYIWQKTTLPFIQTSSDMLRRYDCLRMFCPNISNMFL